MSETKISFEELEASATPAAAATPPATTEAAPLVEEAKPQFTESDVEAYRLLVDAGINPQNIAEFKAAKTAMDNLPKLFKSPDGRRMLLDEIQKNDPEAYAGILEQVSDRWFNELPADQKRSGNDSGSRTTTSTPAPDPRIASLESKLESLVSERNQEKTSKQQAAITDGYNSSVDALLEKLPEGVTERDRDHIRLKTNELIWKDPKAREAVAKGVYMDVSKYFSKASTFVTAETKAAATAEQTRRSGVEARGSKTIAPAAENTNGSAPKREGHGADSVWGDITSDELKAAYK